MSSFLTVIVVPAYNEKKYLEKVLKKIQTFSKHIVVVDDGSSDDSYQIARSLVKDTLRHDINLGKGAAMKTGCEYAFKYLNADAVLFVDSDDQHDPKHIPEFIKKLEQGHNLVFGVRKFTKNMPRIKVLANSFTSVLVKLLFGLYVPDIPSGYKAISKHAYRKICWNATDYGVELEIAARTAKHRMPFDIVTIDTIYHDYDRGMTGIDAIKIILKLLEWRLWL